MTHSASRAGLGLGPVALLLVVGISLGACGGEQSEEVMGPPPPPPEALCVTNNTATLISLNQSASARNYVVVLDGANIGSLAPNDSIVSTIAAGVQHTLEFNLDNLGTPACSPATPTPAQCSVTRFWCTT